MEQWLFNRLTVTKTPNGWIPTRFTEVQRQEYGKNEFHRLRTQCPAGVSLRFRTNAQWVRLSYTILSLVRDYAAFDLFVDEVWTSSESYEALSQGARTTTFSLSGHTGMHVITIYLPHNVELELHDLEFAPESVVETVESPARRLLCLGDSISQGMAAQHPANTYPVLIANALHIQLLNQAVGGYMFNADSLDADIAYRPDVITVAYGTNDWARYTTLIEFRDHCRTYLHKLVSIFPESQIFVMTPIWRGDLHTPRTMGTFIELSQAIAEEGLALPRIRIIDGLKLVPHRAELFDEMGIHPSDEGFLHMGMNLIKHLKQQLV
jgi:hypothetical protein